MTRTDGSFAYLAGLRWMAILDVEAPLKAMNTLKMFAQKALGDFNGYSAACLANDKFCQRLIDLAAVMDGKIVLANTIEE